MRRIISVVRTGKTTSRYCHALLIAFRRHFTLYDSGVYTENGEIEMPILLRLGRIAAELDMGHLFETQPNRKFLHPTQPNPTHESAGAGCSLVEIMHRTSTSMYLLTFCVRVMSPERHHWKPAAKAAAVMLRTLHVDGQSPASSAHRPRRAFALCRHIAGWTQACN